MKSLQTLLDEKRIVTCDVECYKNYLLVMFKSVSNGKVIYFEKFNDSKLDIANIIHILSNYTVVTFNGMDYDQLIVEAAIRGYSNREIHDVSTAIINEGLKSWETRKTFMFPAIECDHIDLMHVAPLKGSLKSYAAQLHCKNLKDLPLPPDTFILPEHLDEMRQYCEFDNDSTAALLEFLHNEIELRIDMSNRYGLDLRSKSDAQIAERVIVRSLENEGVKAKKVQVQPGTEYFYNPPPYLSFKTDAMKRALYLFSTCPLVVTDGGKVSIDFNYHENKNLTATDLKKFNEAARAKRKNAKQLTFQQFIEKKKVKKYKVEMATMSHTLGVGGCHSNDKKTSYYADDKTMIVDYDVAAFYPSIILNDKLYPEHLTKKFLRVYNNIVEDRLRAKKLESQNVNKIKNGSINRSLKIVINGSFGKLADRYSKIYSPDLMAQVTITGQLSILMLAEQLEEIGVRVIQSNTDGITLMFAKNSFDSVKEIICDWELLTGYEMEATHYKSLHARDVNSYVAIKVGEGNINSEYDDKFYNVKGKGSDYAEQAIPGNKLHINPDAEICKTAVKAYLKNSTPISETIKYCTDIRKFITTRKVMGGAVFRGELIGKVARWYYGVNSLDTINYGKSGNKVAKSDGAEVLMTLPDVLPDDIDYQWYEANALTMLRNLGVKYES